MAPACPNIRTEDIMYHANSEVCTFFHNFLSGKIANSIQFLQSNSKQIIIKLNMSVFLPVMKFLILFTYLATQQPILQASKPRPDICYQVKYKSSEEFILPGHYSGV